ncbi:MAG: amidohydrolase family protein [Bilophila wadsworthia]
MTINHAWCPPTPDAVPAHSRPFGARHRHHHHVPGHVPSLLKQARRWQVRYGVGTDNMRNLWGPYGMNDMRERVMLLAYLSDFRRREDLELAYDAGTYGSASVLGLPDYGLSEGCWADMVVFPVENRACALLEGPMPRFVIKRGVLVARDGELTDAVPPCPE